MSAASFSRRQFLEFLGAASVTAAATPLVSTFFLGCVSETKVSSKAATAGAPLVQKPLSYFVRPSDADSLVLASDIQSRILLKWQDPISSKGVQFGNNNDYCAFIPKNAETPNDGVLMVNHEFVNPLFVSGFNEKAGIPKTKKQVELEQDSVGVSLFRFHKDADTWKVDLNSTLNRRITGKTKIPLSTKSPIAGKWSAMGTFANCAGGITPWGTFLTCEENYDYFYGEWDYSNVTASSKPSKKMKKKKSVIDLEWSKHFDCPPVHYGWVVEINPWSGAAKKMTALGRFAHECATCTRSKSGKVVVYMGDDAPDQYLYKFVSDTQDSLTSGTLYVAQLEKGRWLPLTMNAHPEFKKRFARETDLKIRTREAATLVKATPLDRPEDIEINPANGDVIVACTNNTKAGRPHGSLLRLREKNGDPGSLEFTSSTWISGGPEAGLSCPDNLAFDAAGNLWCTTDISDFKMNRGEYANFKNNGLFFIPMHGPQAGQVFQVASAPRDAELTGPCFLPDGKTMLLCVQHPGEQTSDLKNPTSTWPGGPGTLPKSALVALSGPGLEALISYRGQHPLSI